MNTVGEAEFPTPTPSASVGSSSPHVVWRCRGAAEPSIDLAALDEISAETRGRAAAENSTPQQ